MVIIALIIPNFIGASSVYSFVFSPEWTHLHPSRSICWATGQAQLWCGGRATVFNYGACSVTPIYWWRTNTRSSATTWLCVYRQWPAQPGLKFRVLTPSTGLNAFCKPPPQMEITHIRCLCSCLLPHSNAHEVHLHSLCRSRLWPGSAGVFVLLPHFLFRHWLLDQWQGLKGALEGQTHLWLVCHCIVPVFRSEWKAKDMSFYFMVKFHLGGVMRADVVTPPKDDRHLHHPGWLLSTTDHSTTSPMGVLIYQCFAGHEHSLFKIDSTPFPDS